MPRPLTAAGRAALQARTLAVVYLLEVTTDEGVMRCNTWNTDLSYGGFTWDAAPEKMRLPDGIKVSKALVPETFNLEFDGAYENDTSEFIGLLLTRTWHQRPVRFIGLLLNTTDYSVIDEFYTWRGFADKIAVSSGVNQGAIISLAMESGTFRSQERNHSIISHNDQKRRDATDTFFANMAVKQDQQVPYGIAWSKIPGYRPGGSSSGGGGGGGGGFGGGGFQRFI